MPEPLIHLEGVSRVGCGNPRCSPFSACSIRPSDGSYTLNGQSVAEAQYEGAVFGIGESDSSSRPSILIGDLTVYENVELPLTYRSMPSSERRKAVLEALEKVGRSHRVKHYPSQLRAAVSSSVLQWRVRWLEIHPFCWRTNPQVASIP